MEETAFGPLADKKQFERVMSFLDGAKTEGVEVLTGGSRKGDKGTYVSRNTPSDPHIVLTMGVLRSHLPSS